MQSSALNFEEKNCSAQKIDRVPIFRIQRNVVKPNYQDNYEEISTGSTYDEEEETKSIERDRRPLQQSKKIKKDKVGKIRKGQRSSWSQTEDDRVLELYQEHGPKWSKLARLLGDRKPKQVRDRYVNVLNPEIDHSPWTQEEDELFLELLESFGKKWCLIAEHMAGRTENQAKNKFYWHMRKERQSSKRSKKSQNSYSEYSEAISYLESPSDFQESDLTLNILKTDQKEFPDSPFINNSDQSELSASRNNSNSQEISEVNINIKQFFNLHPEENTYSIDPLTSMTYQEMISMKSQTQIDIMDFEIFRGMENYNF